MDLYWIRLKEFGIHYYYYDKSDQNSFNNEFFFLFEFLGLHIDKKLFSLIRKKVILMKLSQLNYLLNCFMCFILIFIIMYIKRFKIIVKIFRTDKKKLLS